MHHEIGLEAPESVPRRGFCWMRKTGIIFLVVAAVATALVLLWRW